MMFKYLSFLLLILAWSCHHPIDELGNSNHQNIQLTSDTTYFQFSSTPKNSIPSSNLNLLLLGLDETYKVIKSGKVIKETSIVYKGIMERPELCYSSFNCYKILDLASFSSAIAEINYVKLDKRRNLDPTKSSTYTIEEIIFYSENDAKTLLDYINHVRNVAYFWSSIDKYPSNIVRQENKLYFIRAPRRTSTGIVDPLLNELGNYVLL